MLLPEGSWEEYGIEDPRITKIDDTYWITYVAVSRSGAATALMSSTDFVHVPTSRNHFCQREQRRRSVSRSHRRVTMCALHRPNPRFALSPAANLDRSLARPDSLGTPRTDSQWCPVVGRRPRGQWNAADFDRRRLVDALPRQRIIEHRRQGGSLCRRGTLAGSRRSQSRDRSIERADHAANDRL